MKTAELSKRQRQLANLASFAAALPRLRATGAQVQRVHAGYYLLRHRGAVIELWPSGKWRPRLLGLSRHVTLEGYDKLIELLSSQDMPAWMTRRRVVSEQAHSRSP